MNITSSVLARRILMPRQKGVTTLAITLLLLVIITLVVLFSTNVAFFEQRTTTNENRARLSEQAAEYALNLSGEFLKANVADIVTSGSGWLGSAGTRRWTLCSTVSPMGATHPCMAEADSTRRNQMYFYKFNGNAFIPYASLGGALTNIGGDLGDTFAATTVVEALLCRLDTTVLVSGVVTPQCRAIPADTSANRIAVVLLANVTLAGENSRSTVKETWASISQSIGGAAVPLVAAGTVKGLGTATIVAGPNGGGYGIPVSVWSPCPVAISNGDSGLAADAFTTGCPAPNNGNGSVQTCEKDIYFASGGATEANFKTVCAANNAPCSCPNNTSDTLSAGGSVKIERHDILDRDGGLGRDDAQNLNTIPDITFFPTGKRTTAPVAGLALDKATDPLDDSMFEYIFGQDIVPEDGTSVPSTCGVGGIENCALVALRDNLNATVQATCAGIGPTSSGLYYITGTCSIANNTAVGSPTSSVILVINGDVAGNKPFSFNDKFYGMLYVRSNNDSASFSSNGGKFFGSVVVEGEVDMQGNVQIVYDNTTTDVPGKPLPANTRFAKVTGSWLDNNTGF